MSGGLYETDFYAWANEPATLLRTGRLAVLLAHLLKWQAQPELRGRSRLLTIRVQRRDLAQVLRDNPGLHSRLPEMVADAYDKALLLAQRETGLSAAAFPTACPWTFDQAMQDPPDETR